MKVNGDSVEKSLWPTLIAWLRCVFIGRACYMRCVNENFGENMKC